MADIPLKSVTFPGLSDRYTTPVVDNTLAVAGAAADAKKTGDEIAELKNDFNQFPNGTYPNMSVGNAEQLTSTVGIEDTTPYLFRTSGGSVDIGDREDINKIIGGTIVWNQCVQSIRGSSTINGLTFTSGYPTLIIQGACTATDAYTISGNINQIENHVYLCMAGIISTSDCRLAVYGIKSPIGEDGVIVKRTSTQFSEVLNISSGATIDVTVKPQAFDITQMLGTTIADYVYSLETATAGTGVAWLKKHFPAQFDAGYQAYDTGSLQSVSGLTAHKMVGFNQWDEQWELGIYDINTGVKADNGSNIRNKNLIRILPNIQYCWNNTVSDIIRWVFYDANKEYLTHVSTSHSSPYVFTTPANACYMAFYYGATSYSGTLCINLHWDGEKDGQYEPYKEYTYPLDDSLTLRGIPKLDTNNQLYYDGDEYLPDGTVNRRYGVVDLGSKTWTKYDTINGHWRFRCTQSDAAGNSSTSNANMVCTKYHSVTGNQSYDGSAVGVTGFLDSGYVFINDETYADAAAFKTAMSGVMLLYELETPTTETADPYQETQIVDDFGTEEFVLADGAFPVPVGHNTMYQNNLRAKLEMSPESPDGDGLYVVQQESGENTYVPLASTATIQDILTRLTALENA